MSAPNLASSSLWPGQPSDLDIYPATLPTGVTSDYMERYPFVRLCERVSQLPVQFFLGENGILPAIPPQGRRVIKRLSGMKLFKTSACVPLYPFMQREDNHSFPDTDAHHSVFNGVDKIIRAIMCEYEGIKEPTLNVLCNRDRDESLPTTREQNTRPDCYGIFGAAASGKLERSRANQTGDTTPCWSQIGTFGELEGSTDDAVQIQNWNRVLLSMRYIMREDARRRFVFAFTIDGTAMRIWFANRANILVSLPFDFIERHRHTVEFFVRMMYADEEELGWDTTMTPLARSSRNEPFQYHIKCANVLYKTVRLISDIGTTNLCGRGTRVWEVRRLNGDGTEDRKPIVLKDAWVDSDRKREHVTLQDICKDAERKGLLEGFERHFMKIRDAGDVYIGKQPDDTHTPFLRGLSLSGQPRDQPNIPASLGEQVTQATCVTIYEDKPDTEPLMQYRPLGAPENELDLVEKILHHAPKVHYRIVFEELGCTIAETDTLSASMSAFADALKGLKILHQCGWVHRDISTGNVLVINGVGKLSDLEYAKHEKHPERHGFRTGTPNFTSAEVEAQRYRYAPHDLQLLKGEIEEGFTAAELLELHMEEEEKQATGASTSVDGQSEVQGPPPADDQSHLLNVTTPSDATATAKLSPDSKKPKPYDPEEFRHNPLHDLESMMWLGSWLLVRRNFKKPNNTSDKDWTQHLALQKDCAYRLFSDLSYRNDVVVSVNAEFLRGFRKMLSQVYMIATELNLFRRSLYARYISAIVHRYQVKEQPPFAPMAEGLHDSLLEQLDRILALLTGPHGARVDLQIDRSVRKNLVITETENTMTPKAISVGGKRVFDTVQTSGSVQRSSKRQKTSRV